MSAHRKAQMVTGSETGSFLADTTLHLRYKRFGEDKLHHVKSLSYAGSILLVQWTQQADIQGLPPAARQDVEIYALKQGMLYISKGTVIELRTGGTLRVSIRVEPKSRRVCLRQHQRYVVRGRLSFGPVDGEFSFEQQSDQEMDISLGGFGCRIPESALANQGFAAVEGDSSATSCDIGHQSSSTIPRVRMSLEVYAERHGRVNPHLPSITLQCKADIRRQTTVGGIGEIHAGFQFLDIPKEELETLSIWLTAHSVHLREC